MKYYEQEQYSSKKAISLILALSFLMTLFSAPGYAEALSLEEQAAQKAQYYREIIMRDVAGCTWTAETQISHTTLLYDITGKMNGCVYEYANGEKPAGFLQIDVSSGKAVLDSYSFGEEHCAAKRMRCLPIAAVSSTDSSKLVYLGGYSYYLLGEETSDGEVTTYDVLNEKSGKLDLAAATEVYEASVLAKSKEQIEQAAIRNNVETDRGANTITKFIQGYTGGLTFATYSNTGDPGNGCTIISAVNSSMYWTKCRGKTGLYTSVPATYNALKSYIPIENSIGTSFDIAYSGYRNYLLDKGFSYTIYGKIRSKDWTWDAMRNVIDKNVPLTMAHSLGYVGLTEAYHAVTIFGYQYIDVVNTVMIADAHSTSLVYKTFSSLNAGESSKCFSYYAGRWS